MKFYLIFVLICHCHPLASFSCLVLLLHYYCNRLTQKRKQSKAKQEPAKRGKNQNEKSTFLFELFNSSDISARTSLIKSSYTARKKDHKLNLLCVWSDLRLCMMRKFTFNRIHSYLVRMYISKSYQPNNLANQWTNQPTKKWKKQQLNYDSLYTHTCIRCMRMLHQWV